MKTTITIKFLLCAARESLLSLVGYPPVIESMLTRRLDARGVVG